ncbi:MAG: ABC transporter substrate-binding protein [Opitutales bacterium]|nr:ABC transporter substrate-binding protein [Opitutales bacterium]
MKREFSFFTKPIRWIGLIILAGTLNAIPPEKGAQRIVSIDAGTDTLVLQLADIGQILAVHERTQDPSVSLQWEKASLVQGLKRDAAEDIYRLQPDLVFFGQWTGKASHDLLQRVGCKVERMNNATSWEEIYSNIRHVGELVGHPERAEAMVHSMKHRLQNINERIAGSKRKRAVFYIGRGSTYGSHSRQNILLESAGLINLSAEKGIKGMGKMTIEELLLERPDIILFSDYQKNTPTISRQILDHPAFKRLQSRDYLILDLPSNKLNCIDTYLVDCVEQLARAAYPEAFAQERFARAETPPPEAIQ